MHIHMHIYIYIYIYTCSAEVLLRKRADVTRSSPGGLGSALEAGLLYHIIVYHIISCYII